MVNTSRKKDFRNSSLERKETLSGARGRGKDGEEGGGSERRYKTTKVEIDSQAVLCGQ